MQDFLRITFTWAITNGPQKLTVSPENEYNRQYHKQRVQQIRWPKYRCTIRTCYNATMLPQPKSASEVLLQTPTFTTPEKTLASTLLFGGCLFSIPKTRHNCPAGSTRFPSTQTPALWLPSFRQCWHTGSLHSWCETEHWNLRLFCLKKTQDTGAPSLSLFSWLRICRS